jgi:uncharacterized membrane protein YkoI
MSLFHNADIDIGQVAFNHLPKGEEPMNIRNNFMKKFRIILWTSLSVLVLMITVISIKALTGSYNSSKSDAKDSATAESSNGTASTNPPTGSTPAYIGDIAARDIVVAKLPGIDITEIHFEFDDGRAEYDGVGYFENVKYDFDIDALTGEILEWEIQKKATTPPPTPKPDPKPDPVPLPAYIGVEAVKAIALAKVPGAIITEICLEHDDGRVEYDGEMYLGNTQYDFTIDAITGNVLEWEAEIEDDIDEVDDSSQGH